MELRLDNVKLLFLTGYKKRPGRYYKRSLIAERISSVKRTSARMGGDASQTTPALLENPIFEDFFSAEKL
jgi:hypothetical protein